MRKFEYLSRVAEQVDEAFKKFYDAMLSDSRLLIFFENQEQIHRLIVKQKEHFKATLAMPHALLKNSYIRLGEYHYDIRIPYVDFIKGSGMLEEYFLLNIPKEDTYKEMMQDIFEYFKIMNAYTAKGYLNRMIAEDKRDIDEFFKHSVSEQNTNLPSSVVYDKIKWLRVLIEAIEEGKEPLYDLNINKPLDDYTGLTLEKRAFIEDVEKRILINTQNLFYFLNKGEYLEILPLYSSLLSIYKLTLMLNNVITFEYANNLIDFMKIDSLCGLYRKDVFTDFLTKEMLYADRHSEYKICVAYLDLDNFKSVNDNFGHYSGDKVIEKFGLIVKEMIRSSDIGFRIGGDEFALIFKNTGKEEANKVCEKIRHALSSFEFIFSENKVFHVGMSIGIVQYDQKSGCDIKTLIQRVDVKLYDAKNNGKNQVSF